MIISLINASPRNENCTKIVDHIISQFGDIAKFSIIDLKDIRIEYCISCGKCKNKQGHCFRNDDADKKLKEIINSDGSIFISPVYMGGMTGQLKSFFDRSVCLRRADFLLKDKIAAAIAVGGSRNGGQELVLTQIHAALHIHGMIIVGDNNHFGGTVHSPFENDEFGKNTVDATVKKVIDTINKVKYE